MYQPKPKVTVTCHWCGNVREVAKREGSQKYCSSPCRTAAAEWHDDQMSQRLRLGSPDYVSDVDLMAKYPLEDSVGLFMHCLQVGYSPNEGKSRKASSKAKKDIWKIAQW